MEPYKSFNEEYFSNILRNYQSDPSIKIHTYSIESACEAGENFTCDVSRIILSGTKNVSGVLEDYTTSVIVKRVPENKRHVEFYRSDIAQQNEFYAYSEIIPALSKYAVEKKLPVPDCIFADKNWVILEDLSIQGYKIVDKANGGFSLKQSEAALSKLHAASIVLGKKEPETMQRISFLTEEPLFYGGQSQLMKSQKSYIENAVNIFKSLNCTDSLIQLSLKVLEELHTNCDEIGRNVLLKRREHSVISHGDAWFGNVMFNQNSEIKLIDLQLMRFNSVAIDLCYLFFVNMEPALCMSTMQMLLTKYLTSLLNNTRKKGVNVEDVYTKSFLVNQMSEFAIYGLMRALWVMPTFYCKPEDVDLDNISLQKLTDTRIIAEKTSEEQKERIIQLVLNYVKILEAFKQQMKSFDGV